MTVQDVQKRISDIFEGWNRKFNPTEGFIFKEILAQIHAKIKEDIPDAADGSLCIRSRGMCRNLDTVIIQHCVNGLKFNFDRIAGLKLNPQEVYEFLDIVEPYQMIIEESYNGLALSTDISADLGDKDPASQILGLREQTDFFKGRLLTLKLDSDDDSGRVILEETYGLLPAWKLPMYDMPFDSKKSGTLVDEKESLEPKGC